MRILTVHNKYKIRGGEDESRESEDWLLAANGHIIKEIVFDNSSITGWRVLGVGSQATWNQTAYRQVRREIQDWHPDIVDIHNFFPIASPAVHYAARSLKVPVVQTLHNFRLLCPSATFYREGRVCEECTAHTIPWPGVIHRCYHDSAMHSGAVAAMITVHRLLGTWKKKVSLFIAVSKFEKEKFVENGFPEERIMVKPNFVYDGGAPGPGGEDFLFVGRLAPEKGIATLLRAAEMANISGQVKIVGDGPLQAYVTDAARRNPRIEYLGRRPQSEVLDLMARSRCVIFPSEWYETFGRVAAEAYSRGTPVIAARIGAVAEIVEDGRTGYQFKPGDARELADAMERACSDPARLKEMRVAARQEYELKYTAERNYECMMAAYERAIANP
jgi:glycosyltransferase involved in cell wall biosynthesis